MVYLYSITNKINNKQYIGITRQSLVRRWSGHLYSSKTKNYPLYNAMRKYGVEAFEMRLLCECPSWKYACELEKAMIRGYNNLYNLAEGGEGGFVVQDKEAWKKKLSESRAGGKPAKGLKHTSKTKEVCGQKSREYWEDNKLYTDEVLNYCFVEANNLFGISKTHYYRLKRARINDPS